MTLDDYLCNLPVIGTVLTRMYTYFRKHIAFTDFIHVSLGLGMGLLLTSYITPAIIFIFIGLGGHVYAFIKG